MLYIESPKHATKKLLNLINGFSKVADYKIDTQKSVVFLSELSETEIKEAIPLTIAPKEENN